MLGKVVGFVLHSIVLDLLGLFYFILFILFCFFLFYSVLFCFILFSPQSRKYHLQALGPGTTPMEMPIPGQIQHRPINHRRFAVPNNFGSKAQFPWKKGTFPAQKSPLSTLPIPIPSESSQSQVGGWKNH